jgi:hypothetical protein
MRNADATVPYGNTHHIIAKNECLFCVVAHRSMLHERFNFEAVKSRFGRDANAKLKAW